MFCSYLELICDGVGQQVAQQNEGPKVEHKRHVKILPNTSGVIEGHSIFQWYNVYHDPVKLVSTMKACLLEVHLLMLVTDIFITEAL